MSTGSTGSLSTSEGFALGGLAACIAVSATNGLEVLKTRMQLDGELASSRDARKYKSVAEAFTKTWQGEGIRGLYRGLGAAYAYQMCLNGCRLGLYEPFRRTTNKVLGHRPDEQLAFANVFSGALSGVAGAVCGTPLFLVKARMQAFNPVHPVGPQYGYKSTLDGLRTIARQDGFGFQGLLRGVDAAALRTAMGSSVQLPAYGVAKRQLAKWGVTDGPLLYILASSFSGACVLVAMQPTDTTLTRMYSQSANAIGADGKPRGLLYTGPIDCLIKTARVEGIAGLYKGSLAHFLRIAPHTVITLSMFDQLSNWYQRTKT